MKSILNECIERLQRSRKHYRRYVALLLVLAMVTTLGVNWTLHQNGISMTADYQCGLEEHTHSEECYTQSLFCTQQETEGGHQHTDACYESVLTCGLEEHQHSISCYIDETADLETADVWEATLPTEKSGVWSDDIVSIAKTQIGYTESETNFRLADDGTTRMHYTRYGEWYGNPYGDWSTLFAAFCLHYTGIANETVPVNSGCEAWIVDLKNASLYKEASEYTPSVGDLVFLDQSETPDQIPEHVGIITELKTDANGTLTGYTVIEGDVEENDCLGTVKEVKIDLTTATNVIGYLPLPENPELKKDDADASGDVGKSEDAAADNAAADSTDAADGSGDAKTETDKNADTDAKAEESDKNVSKAPTVVQNADGTTTQTAETENYTVAVTYGADAELPEDASLTVTEFGTDSEEYKQVSEENGKNYDWLLDISFIVNGEEIEPKSAVSISVTTNTVIPEDEEVITEITHFAEDGTEVLDTDAVEVTPVDEEQSEISFELESLSLVAGTTYHTATPIQGTSLSSGDNFLIYKVQGDYVYFLVNWSNQAKTLKVALSDLPNAGDGTPDLETLSTTCYFTETITGTIDGTRATLTWSNLLWNYYNGWTVRSVYNTRYYLAVGSDLSLSTSDYRIYFSNSSDGKHTHIYRENILSWRLGFENQKFIAGSSLFTDYTNVTIARTSGDYTEPVPVTGGSQTAVYTGTIRDLPLGFYSVALKSQESTTDNLKALAGVTYTFYDVNGNIAGSVVTTDEMRVDISALKLPVGTYTMKMTAVPDGYVCDGESYTFTLTSTSKTLSLYSSTSNKYTGIIIVNPEGNLTMDKNAAVVDYLERTYNVELTAHTDLKTATIDAISIDFVVDQSNSMLFPSYLVEAKDASGNALELKMEKDGSWYADFDSLNKLSQDQVYYFISDPTGSSTVWALWYNKDVKKWCYQDASYYAKAYYANPSISTYDKTKIKTSDTGIYYPTTTYQDFKTIAGGSFGTSNDRTAAGGFTGETSYVLYTAAEEYNRLHYLEQSLSDMLQMLAAMNPNIEVTLDTFYAEVNKSCTTTNLTEEGLQTLLSKVGDITTDGGTRQDLALQHSYDNHLTGSGAGHYTNKIKYVILITDGAIAGSSNNGSATDNKSAAGVVDKSNTAYMNLNYWAEKVRGEATLATVGLSMANVESGKKALQHIATDGIASVNDYDASVKHGEWWYQPDDSSELATILCENILNKITHTSEISDETGTIVDVISDSFYPVDQNGNQVTSGTQIDAGGNVVSSGGIGIIYQDADGSVTGKAGSWYVEWTNQNVGTTTEEQQVITGYTTSTEWVKGDTRRHSWNSGEYYSYTKDGLTYTWQRHDYTECYWATRTVQNPVYGTETVAVDVTFSGHVYLKAKEDFIGGNAINTNKSATLTLKSGGTYEYEKPTVNVRLLGMNDQSSEVTLFKGDFINEKDNTPLDSMKYFFTNAEIQKIRSGTGDVLNKVGATEEQGCKADTFTLPYAAGVTELSETQWKDLTDGKTVTLPYTYNEEDGAVGYFTLSLNKASVEDQTAAWDAHTAEVAQGVKNTDGSNAIETYTLTITYTAYKLGDGRPTANQHNNTGTKSPGTEVGTGDTLETGKGTVESTNVHKVYAIDGTIKVWKEITDELKDADKEQTYTFTLQLQTTNAEGETVLTQVGEAQTVTVAAGSTKSSTAAEWTGLARGTYLLAENDADGTVIKSMTVQSSTNCQYLGNETTSLTFVMGNDTNGDNVIGKADGAVYTSYTGTPNGVLGEAVITNKPKEGDTTTVVVNKKWDDGKEHTGDSITVTLFRDGVSTGKTAALNAENGWSYTFTDLPRYADPLKKTGEYTYTVQEAVPSGYSVTYETSTVKSDGNEIWVPATAFEDGETYLILTSNGTGSVTGMEAAEKGFAWTSASGAGTITVSKAADGTPYITDKEAQNHTAMMWTAKSVGVIKGEQVGYRNAFTLQNVWNQKYAKSNGDGEMTDKANDKANYFYYGYSLKDATGKDAKRQPNKNDSSEWSTIIGAMNDYFLLDNNHTGDGGSQRAQTFYLYKKVKASSSVTTVTVTNHKQYELPKTGGAGTSLFTISGIALLGGALLYGCSFRRRRERRGR